MPQRGGVCVSLPRNAAFTLRPPLAANPLRAALPLGACWPWRTWNDGSG